MPRLLGVLAVLFASALVPAAASAQTPLTPERYAALDAVYAAAVALDADDASTVDLAAVRQSCRTLDSADPLLGPLRKSCTASYTFAVAFEAFGDCASRASCRRTARAARTAVNEAIRLTRAANAAIRAATLVSGCAGVLRSDRADLRLLERFRAFLRLAQRALDSRSPALGRRLIREGKAIDRLAAKVPSAAREREDFRAACDPAAAPAAPAAAT